MNPKLLTPKRAVLFYGPARDVIWIWFEGLPSRYPNDPHDKPYFETWVKKGYGVNFCRENFGIEPEIDPRCYTQIV
jgi:hypothetical protein